MTEALPTCTCLPLNRKLMARLLKVDEGSVHEQDCWERAALTPTQPKRVPHLPGESHRYQVECDICGQPGMVQVSIEPQRAPDGN